MLTRKDLVQAHRLMTMRAGQALLLGEPDNADRPLRRIGIGLFSGLMVGVLLIAGWGIAGLITKDGSIRNMDEATVLIAKGTGTKYVMCQMQKDRLCTAVNYASARLAVQGGQVKVRTVATKSLSKFQRGPLIGIPGAPDALPSSLAGAPWTVCVSTVSHNGMQVPAATLAVGRSLGGTPMEKGTGVVVAADGRYWLIADGTKMELHKAFLEPIVRDHQLPRGHKPLQVPPVWLNGLVPGPEFKAPAVPGYGTRRPAPAGGGKARIGQVYTVEASGVSPQQWFVLLREGLAPLTKTEAWLLENVPGAPAILPISRAVANQAQTARLAETGLPAEPPRVVAYDGSQPLCAAYADPGKPEAGMTLGASLPAIADPAAVGSRPGLLDQVIMSPGTGILAAVTQNEAPTAHVLITEDGRKFPIPTVQDLAKLGYTEAQTRPVLSHLMQLMPQGPALDSGAAVRQIP
ncbi:type VII secretion protein EccB [Actinocorallia libanotica]|uniref:Type VII secretion protein EccB n=1 Tax=Actinocorallia libanotica TaxID=46162 RepID=A0ABP4CGT3_9ACTN